MYEHKLASPELHPKDLSDVEAIGFGKESDE